jgi:hypothetical protein
VYRGDQFLQSSILPFVRTNTLPSYVLSSGDAARLSAALLLDATDCFYSAAISIGDALGGIDRRFFSWATVKLYYSTFYAVQAMLASDGYCLFHAGKSPKWIEAQSGSRPTKAGGSTHESILDYFAKNYSAHLLLSQPIDGVPSLRWLMEKRVQANYSNTGFCEPVVPKHFSSVFSNGISRRFKRTFQTRAASTFSIPTTRCSRFLLGASRSRENGLWRAAARCLRMTGRNF